MRCVTWLLLAGMCAGATTQPATRPSEVADLRRIIADLQRQVATLKAENAKLNKQVVKLAAQVPTKKSAATVSSNYDIKVGMSADDARAAMRDGHAVYDCVQDEEVKVGDATVHRQKWDARNWLPGSPETIWIENDEVVRVRLGDH